MGLELKITEGRLQQDIFKFHWNNFANERGLLFMVFNNPKNKVQGAQLKSKGMVKGVSDLIYLNPRTGRPQFLELKTPQGVQSDDQKKWEKLVTSIGFEYHIVRTVEQCKAICGWS